MLTAEERGTLLDHIAKRVVVAELLNAVSTCGTASRSGAHVTEACFHMQRWERESQCAQWCEKIARDVSLSPEHKHELLKGEVSHARESGTVSILGVLQLTPVFTLAVSLSKLQHGLQAVEHNMASMELAMVYAARGGYKAALKLLRPLCRGSAYDKGTVTLLDELVFLCSLAGSHVQYPVSKIKFQRLLPVAVCIGGGVDDTVRRLTNRLEECVRLGASPSTTFLCRLGAVAVALRLLAKYAEKLHEKQIDRSIVTKIGEASTVNEIQHLKKQMELKISEARAISDERKALARLVHDLMQECEGFLRSSDYKEFGAVWAFAFAKLRWERECEFAGDHRLAKRLMECIHTLPLETPLLSVMVTEARAVLEGAATTPVPRVGELLDVEVPLEVPNFTSQLLFGGCLSNDD
ncbi:hypothetical protein ERJ75_000928700 [Trypanosoma vivax]|uniref:Uncharacterized protein n=1 Tax=Trypanosoma vivax (strain Y486) TaxID=1055687 RepID=G0U3Z5_TRYVY|nr:hypothetical protein TRVL_02117 [Trypanosoma vivax]KAH8612091.1 hypothetical protein ERJ75_000928700 [Trypanosoma vivax]CCC52157.1 conserved hypothetical protein [Trypanosoma vivax Y486]